MFILLLTFEIRNGNGSSGQGESCSGELSMGFNLDEIKIYATVDFLHFTVSTANQMQNEYCE